MNGTATPAPTPDADVLVPLYLEDDEDSDECEPCESTGRVPAVAQDSLGEPYDTSVPCRACHPGRAAISVPGFGFTQEVPW